MGDDDLEASGRSLAERHAEPAEHDPEAALSNFAERARNGDWSMRAALTRFAQPEAVRSSEVFTLVRRLDAALHGAAKTLKSQIVTCDRRLSPDTLSEPPLEPYPDSRLADLARLGSDDPGALEAVLAGYVDAGAQPLNAEERATLPLLGVALHLDALAETLTAWASRGPQDPPIAEVDRTCSTVRTLLDDLGVPVEEGPPPGRRGGRDRGV